MGNEVTLKQDASEVMERLITVGDLSKLTPEERTRYYVSVCESLGLNPLTKPFDYLTLSGKMVLYANRGTTDQLRNNRNISINVVSREKIEDVYIVTARATAPDGRSDESTGVVAIQGLRGDMLANAYMKAETKAKRRVTLSICGLGMLDESEVHDVQGARPMREVQSEPAAPIALPNPVAQVRENAIRNLLAKKPEWNGRVGPYVKDVYGVSKFSELTDADFMTLVEDMDKFHPNVLMPSPVEDPKVVK